MMAAQRAGIDPELAGDAGDDARLALSLLARAASAGAEDRSKALEAARDELARFDSVAHPRLARALADRLRSLRTGAMDDEQGGDGDIVAPAWLHTPELLARFKAVHAAKCVDPRRIRRADPETNPATGAQEFFWPWDKVKGWFGGGPLTPSTNLPPNTLPPAATPPFAPLSQPLQIDPIAITGRRSTERLGPPAGIERIQATGQRLQGFKPSLDQTNDPTFHFTKDLIKKWEGFRGEKYMAPEGNITSGYGRVHPQDTEANIGEPIDPEEAEQNFRTDYDWVRRELSTPQFDALTPQQQASLISLGYNIGPTALKGSQTYAKFLKGDYEGMAKEWQEFRLATDKKTKVKEPLWGLENRRLDELDQFFGRQRTRSPGWPPQPEGYLDNWQRLRGPGT